jgi:hypothetical protein
MIFWFMDRMCKHKLESLEQTPFLHLPQPQSKHTLTFKAATQQTKKHKINLFGFMAVQTQA